MKRSEVTARLDLYRIVCQEGRRTLDDEQDELNGMRTRAVQFTAFVGAATAFLVGTGLLHVTDKDALFYALAATASALSAALIVFLFLLLSPFARQPWLYRMSTDRLINEWIDAEVPQPDEAMVLRELAFQYGEMHRGNELLLKSMRKWYLGIIVVGTAQVTTWAILVWLKA